MFTSRLVLATIVAFTSQGYAQTTASGSCKEPGKICENIWYCEDESYPDNYEACGQDGLVDRVCCDPIYKHTKSRIYCDSLYDKIEIDEYGNRNNFFFRIGNSLTEYIPHVAALGVRSGSITNWTCAGSLISEKYIITAASCFNLSINIVRLGDLDLNRDDDKVGPQEYGIVKHIIHPKYFPPAVYNDLALIELKDAVKFTKFVKPICLHDEKKFRDFSLAESGYKAPGKPDILTIVDPMLGTNKRACELYFGSKNFTNQVAFGFDIDTQICASVANGGSTCQFDIGGSLHVGDFNYVGAKFLAGVTAITKPCSNANEPGLYTRISKYIPWIESIVFPNEK